MYCLTLIFLFAALVVLQYLGFFFSPVAFLSVSLFLTLCSVVYLAFCSKIVCFVCAGSVHFWSLNESKFISVFDCCDHFMEIQHMHLMLIIQCIFFLCVCLPHRRRAVPARPASSSSSVLFRHIKRSAGGAQEEPHPRGVCRPPSWVFPSLWNPRYALPSLQPQTSQICPSGRPD